MEHLSKFFKYHFEHPNYLYFLVSLIMMLIIPSLANFLPFSGLILECSFGLVILMASIYTSRSYKDLRLLIIVGSSLFVLFVLYQQYQFVPLLNPLLTVVFFGMVFWRLMRYVFSPKSVQLNDVLALSAGYLVLGIMAAPCFYVIEIQFHNSFNISGESQFYDLLYFSYITLTGVGYGDIVPLHPLAKSLSLIVGIIGQLYLVILVGIVIGKYLARDEASPSKI